MEQLYTRWGRDLDPQNVLMEYPRPLLKRGSYINLNGYWDYAFTKEFKKPEQYDGQILVPFSPEAVLSGVSRQLQPDEYLWYRRTFTLEKWAEQKTGRRLLLHFGAVDHACVVYVNGQKAGNSVDLHHGDIITAGRTTITFRLAPDTTTQPRR